MKFRRLKNPFKPIEKLNRLITLDKLVVLAQLETGIEKGYSDPQERDLVRRILKEETEDLPARVPVKDFSRVVGKVYKRLKIEGPRLKDATGSVFITDSDRKKYTTGSVQGES